MHDSILARRYRFVRHLGQGAMGTVWLAYDELLSRHVAIKRVLPDGANDPAAVERILREARLAAALHHANSVVVYDRVVEGDVPYVVMEYVPGRTLAEVIATDGPLDVDATARIGAQVAAALMAAH